MTDIAPEHTATTIRIDIVSDVVCPWCIIGYKQLERALQDTGMPADVRWHPFELNPQMPAQGEDLLQHPAGKYGTSAEDSRKLRKRLTAMGSELGFFFNYADDMRIVNTLRAHQLVHWAGTQDREHDLEMALFKAVFTDTENVNNVEVLADIAARIGLDRGEALAVLHDARFAHPVRSAEKSWTERGIRGVPAMVFNQKYLVTGAQGIENFRAILHQIAEEIAA